VTAQDWSEWERSVRDDLIPKLTDTSVVVSIAPRGRTDVKFAVELGLAIMLDKPIIVLARPAVPLPPKLLAVADRVVQVDFDTPEPEMRDALGDALASVLLERGKL
jgi:hypothetical protein